MRRKVLLSSLSVGRCFTLAVEPGGKTEEGPKASRRTDSILSAGDAWKITSEESAGEFQAESATGEGKTFSGTLEVVEVPRQGFERLRHGN